MTATNQSDGASEPADLSELTATDALLDRLGGRSATPSDLLDPTVGALFELVGVVDQPRPEPDSGLAHLVEVLAGRPLYLEDAVQPADAADLDTLIDLDPVIDLQAGDVEPESTAPRVIDLTDQTSTDPADQTSTDPAEPLRTDASVRPIEIPAARTLTGSMSTAPTLIPIQADGSGRRWERALSHVSLPAASVLLLLAVSGGVSAAVTGDPMAPVNGVSRVMAQIPGLDNPQRNLTQVKGEIRAASNAVQKNDASAASLHLAAARRGLPDVPDDQKHQLSVMIANVETLLAPLTPSPVVPTPPVGVGATPPSTIPTSIPGTHPSATSTAVEPSTEPSSDPDPTTSPSAPDDVPASPPADDPTPDATASGS
jgi:hypothetical protein